MNRLGRTSEHVGQLIQLLLLLLVLLLYELNQRIQDQDEGGWLEQLPTSAAGSIVS